MSKSTNMKSDEWFWENREFSLDDRGLIKEIYVWTEHDEREFVRNIGTESGRGILYPREWWLKKYISNNEDRIERHAKSGVMEARKLLAKK